MWFDGVYMLFDLDEIERSLAAGNEETVQFSGPFTPPYHLGVPDDERGLRAGDPVDFEDYIARINGLCATYGSACTVRFYGHHRAAFDAEVVRLFPAARSLVANCLWEAKNLDAIADLGHLTHLGIGIADLKDRDLLAKLPMERLTYFCLEEVGTKALDLAPLARAEALRELRLMAPYKKNIEALGQLDELDILSIAPVKGVPLDFIEGMAGLRTLKLVLGGADALPMVGHPGLENIAVTQTRGLADLGPLERFPALRRVMVSDQPHLEAVDMGPENTALAHLWFYNCPKLARLDGFERLPACLSLNAIMTGLTVAGLRYPSSLTHLHLHTTKRRDEAAEKTAIAALGFIDDWHPDAGLFYK